MSIEARQWALGLAILGFVSACGGAATGAGDETSQEPNAMGSSSSQPIPTMEGAGASPGDASIGGSTSTPTPTIEECQTTDDCRAICAPQPGACLFRADGSATANQEGLRGQTAFVAEVTAVARDVWEPRSYSDGCLGSPTADRIHVSLKDPAGAAWDLSLSPAQVAVDRFAVGEKLGIEYSLSKPLLFHEDERLVIRAEDKVDLFFVAGNNVFPGSPLEGLGETDDSGLAFTPTSVMCLGTTPTGTGCASSRPTVAVSAGATSVVEPCGEEIGDFKVTAAYTPGSCAGVPPGGCDAVSVLFVAGVRRR